jgi:mannose-6-phosphate isomerase
MRSVKKPWGREEIWAETDSYIGKNIIIETGHRLSLQHHDTKEETIRVSSGLLYLEYGYEKDKLSAKIMSEGDSFHIPAKMIHRFKAITECILVEVSTNHLDDIVRYEDDYGRV